MSAVLDEAVYQGAVSIGEASLPLTFSAGAAEDCRIRIRASGLDSSTYVALAKTSGKPGLEHTHFSIRGTTETGRTLRSDNAYITNHGGAGVGHAVEIAANSVVVEHELAKGAGHALRLWFRGFNSYRNSPIETPLGTLEVAGPSRPGNDDDAAGVVQVVAPKGGVSSQWYEQADALLRHMHRGLAVAHGGRLQTPLLQYIHDDKMTATFFAGSAFAAEFAVQYSLHQDPFINALVSRFFGVGPLSDAIWTAVGWMQVDTTFDEVRYLTAMTALEMLTENELPEGNGTVVPKATFKPLRANLEKVIEEAGLDPGPSKILHAKVAELNRRTFVQRIEALFGRFDIPTQDFEDDVLIGLVKLRNAIVHQGVIPDGVNVWPSIILVREIITRIVLSEIGFEDRYLCYIGGQHDREFTKASSAPIDASDKSTQG